MTRMSFSGVGWRGEYPIVSEDIKDGEITDVDIAVAAAILESKLSLDFPTHVEDHHARHESGGADALAAPIAPAAVPDLTVDNLSDVKWGRSTYDSAGAQYIQSLDVSANVNIPAAIRWNDNGWKMYVVDQIGGKVHTYDVMMAYNIGYAVYLATFDASAQDTTLLGMAWNDDGTKMYLAGYDNSCIYSYALTTPYDLSTASYLTGFYVDAQDWNPEGVAWNNDGLKMYMVGSQNDKVYSYELTVAYDISTAFWHTDRDVSTETPTPSDIAWNDDGTKMFVVGETGAYIYSYVLDVPFDIETRVFQAAFYVGTQATKPTGVAWNGRGTKLYITDENSVSIYSYWSYGNLIHA